MSGILNKRQRIVDTVITDDGRDALSMGSLVPAFVSLSDSMAFYVADSLSGSADASARLYFEAPTSLPHDKIMVGNENDRVIEFKNSHGITFKLGSIVSGSTVVSASLHAETTIIKQLDAFKRNMLIGSVDGVFDTDEFELGIQRVEFDITNQSPKGDFDIKSIVIDNARSLFEDPKFSRALNFQFLPPINKRSAGGNQLAQYGAIGFQKNSDDLIRSVLKQANLSGRSEEIRITAAPVDSNLIIQMFEVTNDIVTKLDLVSYGQLDKSNVFFVGKTFVDSNENPTFINIFTVIVE